MGSSGGGSANPAFLSQGNTPMPGVPIAGQAGELKPQERGSYQEFLPEIAPAGQPGYQIQPAAAGARNPNATGLTAEMFKYRSPTGILTPGSGSSGAAAPAAAGGGGGGGGGAADIQAMRDQLAQLQARQNQGGMQYVPGYRGSGSVTDGWQPSEMGSWQPFATS